MSGRRLLESAARSARFLRGAARAAAALAPAPGDGRPRVCYGVAIPAPTGVDHGGIIKLQSLASAFPPVPHRFNLLYLVSSRLPAGAALLAAAARSRGAKVVLNQNGVAYPAWHGPGWEATNQPMRDVLQRADHVLYQSGFCRRSADRFLGRPPGASEVLFNPVDTARFVPSPRRGSGLALLLSGTQDLLYKLTVALDVLALLVRRGVDARLTVTGRMRWMADQREAAGIASRAVAQRGVADRVSFAGPYSQADAPAIYQTADVLLHPKYNDPCPGVVLEAMACGLPIIYSKSGGVPELVGEAAGIGVEAPESWDCEHPPPPGLLADAVLTAFDRRSEMGDAARQRAVERFDVRPWIARHRDLFESLLAG